MSILDINVDTKKTILVYLLLALTAILVDNVYAIFGHGVRSAAMTWMFLYPLLGGTMFYLIIDRWTQGIGGSKGYRAFYNLHNSGIATLTVGSFLKGILEIAGADSLYVLYFQVTGWVLVVIGLLLLGWTVQYIKMEKP